MQTQTSTTQPGRYRTGFGCLALFAMPFAAMGLFALFMGLRDYGNRPNAKVAVITGSIFTGIAIAIIIGAGFAASAARRNDEIKARNPDKPWLWRADWARGIIRDSNKAGAIALSIFAVVWNAISFPLAIVMSRQFTPGEWLPRLILLFPLAGIVLLAAAIYHALRSMKFGTSECHLERVPIVPGRAFRGHIDLKNDARAADGYRVRIALLRYITTGTGKHRTTTERLLWDAQISVPESAAMRGPAGTRVPFQLAIPPDAHVSDETNSNDRYVWRLGAAAEFPGVDYDAQFDVPVFKTGEANDGSEYAAFEQRERAQDARRQIRAASGIRVTPLPGGGEEFFIEARKTIGSVLKSVIFVLVWNAAIVAMMHFHAPWGFPAFFILLDLLIVAATFNYLFGKSTISVDRSGVRVRKQVLGPGSTATYQADAIESIDGATPSQNSTAFSVKLKLRDGTVRALSNQLPDRESADIIAAKMMAHLQRPTA